MKLYIWCILLVLTASQFLSAQEEFWTSVGPSGGIFSAIQHAPDGDLYGLGQCGLFRSADTGKTWMYAGLKYIDTYCLAVDSSGALYVGSYNGTVHNSTDKGKTWQVLTIQAKYPTTVTALAASKRGDLFAWIDGFGVFRSQDGGKNWEHIFTYKRNVPWDEIKRFSLVDDSTLFTATRDGLVFRSVDYGASWVQAGVILGVSTFSRIPGGKIVAGYVRDGGGGLYEYIPETNSWKLYYDGEYGISRSLCTSFDGVMYAIFRTLMCSLDSGRSWHNISGNYGVWRYSGVHTFDKYIFASAADGVYRSSDRGATWEKGDVELSNHLGMCLTVTPSGRVLAGTSNGIYGSDNHGDTWQLLGCIDSLVLSLFVTPAGTYLASLSIWGERRIVRSEDEGKTWYASSTGFINAAGQEDIPRAWVVDSKGRIYAGAGSGVFYSDDDGRTWTYVYYEDYPGSDPPKFGVSGIVITKDDILYFVTMGNGIYRSEDGLFWKNIFNEDNSDRRGGPDLTNIVIDSRGKFYASATKEAVARVYYSYNGLNWGHIGKANLDSVVWATTILAASNNDVYLGVYGDGVRLSTDGGASWQNVTSGLIHKHIYALAQDSSGYIYAATAGGGIHRSRERVAVSVAESTSVNSSFSMCYPNPATNNIEICYRTTEFGFVRLTITDIMGKIVAEPFHDQQTAGEHRIAFSLSGLSAGIYIYRIEMADKSETGQITIVR